VIQNGLGELAARVGELEELGNSSRMHKGVVISCRERGEPAAMIVARLLSNRTSNSTQVSSRGPPGLRDVEGLCWNVG